MRWDRDWGRREGAASGSVSRAFAYGEKRIWSDNGVGVTTPSVSVSRALA